MGKATRDDLSFIMTPAKWPFWPLLPLRRSTTNDHEGVLWDGHGPILYLANLYSLVNHQQEDAVLGAMVGLESCKYLEYRSFEAMLDDGWVID